MFTPGGMETSFDAFAALPADAVGPPVFASIGREVGMEGIGPPLATSDPL